MNTLPIYEKAFRKCANDLEYYRDLWDVMPESGLGLDWVNFCDLWGSDSQKYQFILNQSRKSIKHALEEIIKNLLKEYNYTIEFVPIKESDGNYTIRENSEQSLSLSCLNDVLAFIVKQKGHRILYIFKEFGLHHQLPFDLISKIKEKYTLDTYLYISFVSAFAYTEVLNHNDNETDPSRGTHLYSLAMFFKSFFGEQEYSTFIQQYDNFKRRVNEYFGLSLVMSLRKNTLFTYRKNIRDNLYSFDYPSSLSQYSSQSLSEDQKNIIDEQFLNKGYLSALTSHKEYSKCFMTAEWLYMSLIDSAQSVDMTAISMGYFKALEQFLYDFIGMHTSEKDNKRRAFQIEERGKKTYRHFTDDLYVKKKKYMTLGRLAEFFRSKDNRDLLQDEISNATFECLRDILSKAIGERNGYFHKDNISDVEKVIADRQLVITIFYLLLGAFKYTTEEAEKIGVVPAKKKSAEEKLCEYINRLALNTNSLNIPVLFIGNDDVISPTCYLIKRDNEITYDNYGEPQYSGINIQAIGNNRTSQHIPLNMLPKTIYKGTLSISKAIPIHVTLTERKLIYQNGVFLADLKTK